MNKLWGMRAYLIGPIDRADDGGVIWRKELTPFLEERGVVVLDPCNKPINIGLENVENRNWRQSLKKHELYKILAEEVRLLRVVDLRMVDMSDFLIVYLDMNIHTCGSYEEIFWANRLKRPILIVVEQGKEKVPDWLLGSLPNEMIFNNWTELKHYLKLIDSGLDTRHFKRWMFFDYAKMLPKVPHAA